MKMIVAVLICGGLLVAFLAAGAAMGLKNAGGVLPAMLAFAITSFIWKCMNGGEEADGKPDDGQQDKEADGKPDDGQQDKQESNEENHG